MRYRQLVTALFVTLHVSAAAVVCGQAAPAIPISAPVEIQTPQIIEALRLVRSYTELGLSQEFVVREDTRFDGVVLAVDTLTLNPGSRLILGRGSGDRADRFIIARKLRVLHGEPRGIITWDREAPLDIEIPVDPRAPAGSMGPMDGADGAAGANGNTGNEGYPGRSAPTLYLLVDEMEGSPLLVDLRGQNGGRGGKGQPGGEGGMGRNGRSAVSSIIDCRSGGGDGGSGGRGGNGGKGGTGGRGGNGGTLILVAPEERLGSLQERIHASVQQGMGGQGGSGGEPGPGGDQGLGGSGEGFCNGGRPGVRGANGLPGSNGDRGADGASGIFGVTPLTAEQARVVSLRE